MNPPSHVHVLQEPTNLATRIREILVGVEIHFALFNVRMKRSLWPFCVGFPFAEQLTAMP